MLTSKTEKLIKKKTKTENLCLEAKPKKYMKKIYDGGNKNKAQIKTNLKSTDKYSLKITTEPTEKLCS